MTHTTGLVTGRRAATGGEKGSSASRPTRSRLALQFVSRLALQAAPRRRLVPTLQPDLEVNRPGDPFEQEAEAIAARAVGDAQNPRKLYRQPAEEEQVQRAGEGGVPSVSASTAAIIRSPGSGRPLAPAVRDRIEPHLGADLSGVRVHQGPSAASAAASLNARAFTHGRDVFLSARASPTDVRLMAHEATHTVQQGAVPLRRQTEDEQVQRAMADEEEQVQRAANPPDIQRGIWDDITGVAGAVWDATGGALIDAAGHVIGYLADLGWELLERVAPNFVPVLRKIIDRGIVGYLIDLVLDAIKGVFGFFDVDISAVTGIIDTFQQLFASIGDILSALASGDCEPLFAALRQLMDMVGQIAGDAWDAIADFFRPIGEFFSDLWERFGAPALDWLGEVAGDAWEWIKNLGKTIWEWTEPVRDALGRAWEWVKEKLGFGGGEGEGSGEGGLIGWVSEKLSEAWGWIKEQLAPVIEPITAVWNRIVEILPLDAILNLRDTVVEWLNGVGQMANAMNQPEGGGVVENQASLRNEILPAVLARIQGLRDSLVAAGAWVGEKIGGLAALINNFLESVRSNEWLSWLSGAIGWIQETINSMAGWAQSTVTGLFSFIGSGLVHLSQFIEPVLNFLQRVAAVIGDLIGRLPDLILGPLWRMIPACIRDPIRDFIVNQILRRIPIFGQLFEIPDIWARVSQTALRILRQVFVDGDLLGAAWTFFQAVLRLLGIPPELVLSIISKAAGVFGDILMNPVGFMINLLRAVRAGFSQFFDRIGTYLLGGVADWLFGQVREAGITPPTDLSFRSILDLALQILGLTVERIFARLADRIGPERVARLRRALDIATGVWRFVERLVNEGPAGLWEEIQDQLSNLWEMIRDAAISWLMENIIRSVTRQLLSMLDPTGIMAVVNSLIAIYRAIQSAIRYARQILEMIDRVLDGIGGIARGAIEQAAGFLVDALRRAIPIAIGFLANQAGLGNIAGRIREVVEGIRERVNQAISWLIDRAIRLGQSVLNAIVAGGRAVAAGGRAVVGRIRAWWEMRKGFRGADGQQHTLYFEGEGTSARLMVRTTPAEVGTFLNTKRTEAASISDQDQRQQQLDAITQADGLLPQITTAKGNLAAADQRSQTQRQAMAVDANQALYDRLTDLLDQLAEKLGVIFTRGPADFPPIMLPPFANNVKASGVTARYLRRQGLPAGSEANAHRGNLSGWSRLQSAGLTAGARWVKMHLLTAQLGGQATDSNLVAARGPETNTAFYNAMEQHAIAAIGNPNTMIWYRVNVSYHGAPNEDYISSIDARWGEYQQQGDQWVEGPADPRSFSQSPQPPDLSGGVQKVNLNTAGRTQIANLLGGDESLARILIDERNENGPYNSYLHLRLRVSRRERSKQGPPLENLEARLEHIYRAIVEDRATFQRT